VAPIRARISTKPIAARKWAVVAGQMQYLLINKKEFINQYFESMAHSWSQG
jgi:hypothetical protein